MINETVSLEIKSETFNEFAKSASAGKFFIYNTGLQSCRFVHPSYGFIDSLHCCREVLSQYWLPKYNYIGFFYNYSNFDVNKINSFLEEIETMLDIQKSEIYRTNVPDVIIIKVAPFWLETITKRQFFSLFLRCGIVYNKGKLDDSLLAYGLTYKIFNAVKLFLAGNTVNTKDDTINHAKNGIVEFFSKLNQKELEETLIKPVAQ